MDDSPHTPRRRAGLPSDHKLQLYTQMMHVGVVVMVVLAAVVLALRNDIRASDATTILGAALGYAGGAAASSTRTRSGDGPRPRGPGDAGR